MLQSILLDEKRIIPSSVYLEGEYGLKNVFIGVPVQLGKNGAEKIIELSLTPTEKEALRQSAQVVTENMTQLEKA